MKIAVVGCGIGGLAVSSLLSEADHNVVVFDQYEKSAPVGSGLVIQPVGFKVLEELGIGDEVLNKGARGYHMLGLEVDSGRKVLDVSYGEIEGEYFGLGIHRASLFDALLAAANKLNVEIQLSSKVVNTSLENGLRTVELENGNQQGPFDLVIDASGVNSSLSPLKATELEFGAIWGTVDWPAETSLKYTQLEQRYRKAHNMIGVLPIGFVPNDEQAKATLFWSLPQDEYEKWLATDIKVWQEEAIALWPELAPFVKQIEQHDQMSMARYSHGQLLKPYEEALAFIGDSAHRASPQLGQGANMALLDAYALSKSLKQYPINKALESYTKSRRLHVMVYQGMSWAFTPMYQSNSRILPWLRDWLLAPMTHVQPMPKLLSSLVKGTMINAIRGLGK